MATVEDVLEQVDGLRRDAADRVATQFATVTALASATTDQLTQITGIGQVMAERIHAAAAGAKGGEATTSNASASQSASTSGAGEDPGLVGKVLHTATTAAVGVVGRAVPVARRLVGKVTKRGR